MIKQVFFIGINLVFTLSSFSQSPGGVSSGMRAWFRANSNVYNNAGTILATSTQSVQQWNDISGNALHLSQATASLQPVFMDGSTPILNYNPYLNFTNNVLTRAAPGLFNSGTTYNQVGVYTVFIDDDNSNLDWFFYQGTNGFNRISCSFNYASLSVTDFDLTTGNRLSFNPNPYVTQVDFDKTQKTFNKTLLNDNCNSLKNNSIILFPNPADGQINLYNTAQFYHYRIVNALGQIVKAGLGGSEPIFVNELSEGVYSFQIFDNVKVLTTNKLVISRN